MVPRRRAPFPATRLLPGGVALLVALLPGAARAQDAGDWNGPDALGLIERAREVRQRASVDPELRAYQAAATGHVFFLVDRPDSDQRTLIKVDQIALEVYWGAPQATRQRIVGLRDQKLLPTNIRYHLDHLTVVQDDFGDLIQIGDGDEVAAVAHPAAPGSDQVYDFSLGDSITIAFGEGDEVRVQEIQVRPRTFDGPGFVGSMFVDRSSAAIVRMTFTFTPASYVDSYLDYIRISFDNSLWEGKWWLPYRQEIEIRRELPQLDFLAGSVIRGRFEIGDYVFNPDLPEDFFRGTRVTAVSEEQRRSYPFREPLIPAADSEALSPTPSLEDVRAQALRLTAGRYLGGLARVRLHVPAASHLFRWNRAEGAFVGFGVAWLPREAVLVQTRAGWAFGPDEPALAVTLTGGQVRPGTGIHATLHEVRDLGPFPGVSGALNTVAALTSGRDWLDPWFSSAVETFHTVTVAGASARLALRWERHRTAASGLDPEDAADFRPLRTIEEGDLAVGAVELRTPRRWGGDVAVRAELGRFEPRAGSTLNAVTLIGTLAWEHAGPGTGSS